ncbi:MAG: cytochrome c3 family protein [Bacteroidota bacterium]
MKKLNLLLTVIAMLMFAPFINAQTIVGSAHDFSTQTWNTSGEICKVCHTPHNADITVLNAPLWNHQLSAFASYTVYSSATMNATVGQPDGSSKLCLSCHDGTVALQNFGGVTNGTTYMTGPNLVGTNLGNDHPVSFTYDAALATADPGLFNPTTHLSGLGGTITNDLLIAGKLQCSSCHDVHNNAAGTPPSLLVKSNAASALCLTCHNK